MTSFRRTGIRTRRCAYGLALLVMIALVACDGNESDGKPTATEAVATEAAATSTPPLLVSEAGETPIFWRTADDFASLRAGVQYKVLFRITNGYEEQTLVVVAEQKPGRTGAVEFEAGRADPAGEEAPGSYYPLGLMLPNAGRWIVIVRAGDDMVSFSIEVLPPD